MARGTRATAAAATAVWAGALAVNRSLRRVRGDSMAPTLDAGDLVAVVPRWRLHRGDVLLVRDPRGTGRVTVKRLVGLPGERVEVRAGSVRVDGAALAEPYAAGAGPDAVLDAPAGHVVVLGDARGRSTDARVFGPVPLALVEGHVVARVHPAPRLLTVPRATTGARLGPAPG